MKTAKIKNSALKRSLNVLILWSISTFVGWMVFYFFLTNQWYGKLIVVVSDIFGLCGFILGIINSKINKWQWLPWIELCIWLIINGVWIWAYSFSHVLRLNTILIIALLVMIIVNKTRIAISNI